MRLFNKPSLVLALLIGSLALALSSSTATAQQLFVSERLSHPSDRYTRGIEGPAVDKVVVNFLRPGTIGRIRSGQTRSELFAALPQGSIGSGIRFDRNGRMFVADFKKHNIFVFAPGQTTARVYFRSNQFDKQPNDLAIANDGTLYASDPNFGLGRGQIWRIKPAANGLGVGAIMQSPRRMGVTNGLDLSPDGRTLYVGELTARELWAYRIEDDKLVEPRLVKKFDVGEPDGLRTDVDGRIFITLNGDSKVSVLTPDGNVVRDVRTLGRNPSNLTFGGADGRTVYVTQVDGRFVERFLADRPGREICVSGSC